MSIENNLKRIADSLEKLAAQGEPDITTKLKDKVDAAPPPEAVAPDIKKNTRPVAPPPPAKLLPDPKPGKKMTEADLNKALGEEYTRLGGREEIDKVLLKHTDNGSISNLAPSLYATVLTEIRGTNPHE